MSLASYIIGVQDISGGQSQTLIPCVGTCFLTAPNTTDLPEWMSFQDAQSNWTESNSSAVGYIKNKPSIPAAQIQSDWTQSNSSSVDFIKNKPAARSQSSASRSLNTAFQIDSTRDGFVNYSVDIATTATLVGGQTGTVYLEIASDSGFTTNVQELARFVNGNSVSLAIAITLNQNVTGTLSGYVPGAYYVRIRTQNNTGTPTFTYRSGQEVLL